MPKRKAFVIMPFKEELNDLWELGIRETIESMGWECERADVNNPGFILSQIYDKIRQADCVIAEMSGGNLNVFYEVGYAHGQGKTTILLAASHQDLLAFDLNSYRYGFHSGRATEARRVLRSVFRDEDLVQPQTLQRDRGVLYDFPLQEPSLEWLGKEPGEEKPRDTFGGQTIVDMPNVGSVIIISNTDSRWNWWPKRSLMSLGHVQGVAPGDKLTLEITASASARWKASLIGDIGWVNQEEGLFAKVVDEHNQDLAAQSGWGSFKVEREVQVRFSNKPDVADSSLLNRGVHFYVATSVGPGQVVIRRMTLTRSPKEQLASPPRSRKRRRTR